LTGILEIPDEPPRAWRGVPSAILGGAIVVVTGVVLARTFGVGGFVRGRVLLGVCVPVPAAIAAWALAGPHRFRTLITALVMVAGVLAMPIAGSGATPSAARLSAMIDGLRLPGEVVHEVRVGNGRCRPACSEVRRTATVRGIAFAKAKARLQVALRLHDFTVREYGHTPGAPTRIDAESDDMLAQFELRMVDLATTRIAIVVIAKGPASDYKVG
jgi:hypothetical protein